ncbi:hypothetical protein L1049_004361 [Liquidambar formosana]|uniref:Uncharacterized protein n=1 Tax=Liquidambar formosana TaxID=63359 RepID=A0AAP0RPC5_LIQFO
MKIPKVPSWVFGYCLWILVFAISIVFLRSYFQDSNSVQRGKFQFSTKALSKGSSYPPVLAYWILGSNGDGKRILRLLKAIYHPRNQYLLQLDDSSSEIERGQLALSVQSEKVFEAFGNVDVVGTSYAINPMGSSALAATLHAAALLLKISTDWDWFITLSASDYPLMTQDDLLHAFTFLPRDLNFISYTSNTSWNEQQKISRIVVDPSLYYQKNTPIMFAVETRATPDAFKIFGGSPWVILSRAFMDYCVKGWDNLPRKLLMYFSNVAFPLESYFHSVLCNSPEFQNTTVNNDLRYIIGDTSPNGEPHVLNMSHYDNVLATGAVFARPFQEGDLLLHNIDENVLNRLPDGVVPGNWCSSSRMNKTIESSKAQNDLCSTWGNINAVKPGSYGIKFRVFLSKLAAEGRLRTSQCHQ